MINGGDIAVVSTDDGINATTTSGVGLKFTGGKTYVYAGGDGLDSNSRTSHQGISFEGGEVLSYLLRAETPASIRNKDIPIPLVKCLLYLLLIPWSMKRQIARTSVLLQQEKT